MSIRLIAIDLDGTLLSSTGTVSARNLAALHDAQSTGVEIVIATGRRHSYAMKVVRPLALDPANALVSSNGTSIRTIGSELLHRTVLPVSTALWLCTHMEEFRSTLVLTFDRVGPDGDDTRGALVVESMDDLEISIGGWMRSNENYFAYVSPIEDALQADAPIQMMLCGPVERMRRAEARLLKHEGVSPVAFTPTDLDHDRVHGIEVALHRTEYPNRDLSIVDILPAGCSKASALVHLAQLRGIDASQILAIGDNWNDVAMLDYAGQSVLMANAPEDLLAMARVNSRWPIGASNDDDGVAQAIEAALHLAPATESPRW